MADKAQELSDEIVRDDSDGELLRIARQRFQDAVDHTSESHGESHRAMRYYYNSEMEGQWESDDLAYLREQQRMALTFNITRPKINAFLGLYADGQRLPVVVADGEEDELLADVINDVAQECLKDAKHERHANRQLRTGTVAGECSLMIEVIPHKERHGWIDFELHRILPYEVHWDATSIEPDHCDAGHVFWSRWMNRTEFELAYPEHKDAWSEVDSLWSADPHDVMNSSELWSEIGDDPFRRSDYDDHQSGRYYYDRHLRKIRVIRYEYKEATDIQIMVNHQTGESREIGDDEAERIQLAIDMGHPFELRTKKTERVRVCEFVGSKVLRKYEMAGPFEGFSIVTYSYAMDEETGTSHGMVRDLFDPQQELNKSKSLEIEYIAQGVAPHAVAEEGAISDEDQYSAESRRPGGVAIVKKDALVEGRVQERDATPPSPALMNRTQGAIDLANEISGMPSTANITPGEAAQAGVTVAIRYNKARQSVQDPFANFEEAQECLVRKFVESIVSAMPDDQIEFILQRQGKLAVQNGMVFELAPSPDGSGQMVPVRQAELRGIRKVRYSLELEHRSENSTVRMVELEQLLALQTAGVPVDPEVLVSKVTSSRAEREKLVKYVEEMKIAQSKQAEQEAQSFAQQTQASFQLEQQKIGVDAAKVQETTRSNMADEALEARKLALEGNVSFAELWADADAATKDRLLKWAEIQRRDQKQVTAGG